MVQQEMEDLVFNDRAALPIGCELVDEELWVDTQKGTPLVERNTDTGGLIADSAVDSGEQVTEERLFPDEFDDRPPHLDLGLSADVHIEARVISASALSRIASTTSGPASRIRSR